MTQGTRGQGEGDMTYPSNPVDTHTPPPTPPSPAPAYAGGVAAGLAIGAHLLAQPVAAACLMVAAAALEILYLAAMPYTGPIINPPPPPPPSRAGRWLIATAAILFALAVLAFGLESRLGFLGAGVLGIVSLVGGFLAPTGQASPAVAAQR
jgi:hypothetical protein